MWSVYARHWLRLAGITIGNRAEVSIVVELNRLTSFAEGSFATDDVVFAGARARGGHRADRGRGGAFLGNGAILQGDTKLGSGGLIGVLTTAPRETSDGTSWFGSRRSSSRECPTSPIKRYARRVGWSWLAVVWS